MDVGEIMKQAQLMQERMLALQTELGEQEISHSAGDGLVVATINGRKLPLRIKLDPRVLELSEVGLLEDLIMVALNRASEKADDLLSRRTEALMAELNLPSSLELPKPEA